MTDQISKLLNQARHLAQTYKALTGKPLGITGEIGEFEAAKHLGLSLVPARQMGMDAKAIKTVTYLNGLKVHKGDGIEIKTRSLSLDGLKKTQSVSKLNRRGEWDFLALVLLDETYNAKEIYLAGRKDVLAELKRTKKEERRAC